MSSQQISVTAFGAVGDGATDDTAALQNAFDYAAANGDSVLHPHLGRSAEGRRVAGDVAAEFEIIIEWQKANKPL